MDNEKARDTADADLTAARADTLDSARAAYDAAQQIYDDAVDARDIAINVARDARDSLNNAYAALFAIRSKNKSEIRDGYRKK